MAHRHIAIFGYRRWAGEDHIRISGNMRIRNIAHSSACFRLFNYCFWFFTGRRRRRCSRFNSGLAFTLILKVSTRNSGAVIASFQQVDFKLTLLQIFCAKLHIRIIALANIPQLLVKFEPRIERVKRIGWDAIFRRVERLASDIG